MSCVYCDPKSRMRIMTWKARGERREATARTPYSCLSSRASSLFRSIIRRLFGDENVVHVAFAESGHRDAHEARHGFHFADGAAAEITHAGAQAADQLMDVERERSLIRNAPLDAFGDELRLLGDVALPVTALAAFL